MEFVIYVCSCGNYVAQPTIDGGRALLPGHVELSGQVWCNRPGHGIGQPEMRRIRVQEVEAES